VLDILGLYYAAVTLGSFFLKDVIKNDRVIDEIIEDDCGREAVKGML